MFKGSLRHPFRRPFAVLLLIGLTALGACSSAGPYQGLTPDQLLERGLAAYEREDWDEAAEVLDRLLLQNPNYPRAAEARIRLADAYFEQESFITASTEYERFLQRNPGHEDAPRAALGLCRSYVALSPISQRDQTYTYQAANICQNVARDYRSVDEEVADRAQALANDMRWKLAKKVYDNADFYANRGLWDPAIIYYEDVVENFADTEWAPRAMLGLVAAYREIDYPDEVEAWRLRLLNSYPDSPEARSLGGDGAGEDPEGADRGV
jgi:outer membrane protein assembly factor BamD